MSGKNLGRYKYKNLYAKTKMIKLFEEMEQRKAFFFEEAQKEKERKICIFNAVIEVYLFIPQEERIGFVTEIIYPYKSLFYNEIIKEEVQYIKGAKQDFVEGILYAIRQILNKIETYKTSSQDKRKNTKKLIRIARILENLNVKNIENQSKGKSGV